MDYETLRKMFSSGIQEDAMKSIIKMCEVNNPLKITIQHTESDQIISLIKNSEPIVFATCSENDSAPSP